MIADVGSGGGYYTLEFAEKAGRDGKVFAVDTNENLLQCINAKLKKRQLQNVATLTAGKDGFRLGEGCCDLIFMRNVFSSPVRCRILF